MSATVLSVSVNAESEQVWCVFPHTKGRSASSQSLLQLQWRMGRSFSPTGRAFPVPRWKGSAGEPGQAL